MEDLYLDEMAAPGRDFVLAAPGGSREVLHVPVERLLESAPGPARRRLRAVACGFPDRRLRVSMRLSSEEASPLAPGE